MLENIKKLEGIYNDNFDNMINKCIQNKEINSKTNGKYLLCSIFFNLSFIITPLYEKILNITSNKIVSRI